MKKTLLNKLLTKYIITLFSVMGVIFTSAGQCPIVVAPIQTFCDVETPTIANLSATNNGGGVIWYADATSTTPLSNSIGLVNGEDYYADDASGTCGSRQRVDVTIYGPPIVLGYQGVCVDDVSEATISDLFANGNDVRWYTTSTGGTALAGTTILSDNTYYYADQSNPFTGCRTSRISVEVLVGVALMPTGSPLQVFCSDTQYTVADLVASGDNEWYLTNTSPNALDPSTPLVDGQSYFATTLDPPCKSAARLEVTVVFEEPNNAGSNGEIEICQLGVTGSGSINLFEALLGTPVTTGTWSGPVPISNGNTGTVNMTSLTEANSPYVFTYRVSSKACAPSTSTVTVFVIKGSNPGMDGTLALCSNSTEQDLFDSLKGDPEPGGIWSPALASGTGVFNPDLDLAGEYTYTVQGVPPCGDATAKITVIVNPEAQPGTNSTLTLCENSAPINLFDNLGGNPDSGGSWTPALNGGANIFDPSKDLAGKYIYTVKGIAPCGDASAEVTVVIAPVPNAGSDGRLAICSNEAPQNLFVSLGVADGGGTWSPQLVSGTGFFDPTKDAAGSYTYSVTTDCGTDSANVIVSIIPQPNITGLTLSANSICLDEAVDINLSGATQLANGNYSLNYSLSGANTLEQTVAVTITDGSTTIILPASQLTTSGTTTFTILNLLNPVTNCGTASGILPMVQFSVEDAQTPQLVTGGASFCENDDPTLANLTSNLIGGFIITWYDALENGTAYGGDTLLVDGTTYYASNTTTNNCGIAIRLAVTVNIELCEPLKIVIPDGFSPNGDNINDTFFIKNLRELYPNFKLQIYNRYGNVLYKGDNTRNDWDGTSNQGRKIGNGILPVGVYYYILEFHDGDTKTIQGSVYLNR
ncbi:gliding motility-associated-like protein [Gelidibacter algens]|uniref:Gliding motility-associated-like protein n=1 Tax=Gelidibacter algens TaxID=49280 RepID=A0A327SFE1_9FLAO|nr:gliding motility-associated C-terminal domain-containing protein [Gelidibacter algens]RAJ27746.1 gliding motility-associated-like protein [Gelidibacter algens]